MKGMSHKLCLVTRRTTDRASMLRCRGYRTSSLTMLSNTSSSSSPGNGDYTR